MRTAGVEIISRRRWLRLLGEYGDAQQAAMNKCSAQSNKSSGRAETTKGQPTECPYVEYSETYRPNRTRDPSRRLCRA
jgi:hypothetical protein